ncbi:MAG TPA: DDE-type integrase/transposase/recombinase [Candidatus Bathyarchaeia archaeon]|nr:DDE-type integrase/transposase/recombinase [Candidatus Bathyarchaeia archaeon]
MANQITTTRQERGETIAKAERSQITRIDHAVYIVKSQSGHGEYTVCLSENEWCCECPDHKFRGVKCKHIWAVELSLKMREQICKNIVIEEIAVSNCQFCHSPNIKKYGVRKNKNGHIQRFLCDNCGKTFSVNIGFERMKHNPQAITSAMQLYFSGESLRNTMKSLRLLGVEVSHQTVYNWIAKYVAIMKDYVEKLVPDVSDTWRADELYVKIKGDMKYLFALIDDETRFWIAQEVAESKYKHDARVLFQLGVKVAGKKPMTLITDGLPAYHDAFNKEFWTMKKPRPEHINAIKLSGNMNNNKMERFNGEVRDREKTMRGLKTKETPILQGYQIFHNYIREHEGLEGKTPAEACGVSIQGKNKWLTLIQNASMYSANYQPKVDKEMNQPKT